MPITVKRLSDGQTKKFDIEEHHRVRELKEKIQAEFAPKTPHGCRLITVHGKVMKSIHTLKHYQVGNNGEITMDDSKDWSSSSSSDEN